MSGTVTVVRAGALTTVQDRGRTGYAALGVPRAGALDAPAAALARRLLDNHPDAAVLELTAGGLALGLEGPGRWVALTGAVAPWWVDGRAAPWGEPVWWPGGELRVGAPTLGLRSYLAIGGGFAVPSVLGSRSSDTLAGLGPAPLRAGDRLPLGAGRGHPSPVDVPPPRPAGAVHLHPGPRADWFAGDVLARLAAGPWRVRADSNRVGIRLEGEGIARTPARAGSELPSEPMVLGAVQVPPDGRPVVFMNDHPPTGGYPVAAVVEPADLWRCAQAVPGEMLRFSARQPRRRAGSFSG